MATKSVSTATETLVVRLATHNPGPVQQVTGCSERSAVKRCSVGLDVVGGSREGQTHTGHAAQEERESESERERERREARARGERRETHWKTKHGKVNTT